MAQGLGAHAVFLRRVLAQLVRADLIRAREGRDGGYRLARPADQITLAEIYQAVNAADPPDPAEGTACAGGVHTKVLDVLDEIEAEAERRVCEVLGRATLASILERLAAPRRPA
jgi:Rrf2 family protein